jgi:NAD(P)-dependent dehydrogenase (short-subunit alcohol dehydrogenase family)
MSGGKPVAIVTGAARGIGRGCALALAEAGFHLALCDRPDAEVDALLNEVAELTGNAGAESLSIFADVADLSQHEAILAAAVARWGRADCLVNNAGVGVLQRGDLLEVSPESFDRCLAVNTRAMFFLSQVFARHLLKQGELTGRHRSIINITSSNAGAVSVSRGEYCVSKAGASMATQLFALRLAAAGIGVYEIRPGVIETGMTLPVKEQYDARIREGLVPAGRWGYPADVAAAVVTLAEGRMPYTVGQVIAVDGGLATPRF